jgi:ABC transport system ATP-binding/permease protein
VTGLRGDGVGQIRYGLFARFADWFNGLRDGLSRIPERPPRTFRPNTVAPPTRPPRRVTTPHREYLIRMAQDGFAHERIRFEAAQAESQRRLAETRIRLARREEALARAATEVAEASVPLIDAELNERRLAEAHRPLILVRRRRRIGHQRRINRVTREHRTAEQEHDVARTAHDQAQIDVDQQHEIARGRVRRIHEHIQLRIAAYKRVLVRTHQDGAWVNHVLGVLEPEIPGWATTGDDPTEAEFLDHLRATQVDEEIAPAPLPNPIPLGEQTRFGADPNNEVPTTYYYAAPVHFELRRVGAGLRLVTFGHGYGPFIEGRQVIRAELGPGDHFDFGSFRYQVSADSNYLEWGPIGGADLIVWNLTARTGEKTRLDNMSVVQPGGSVMAILGPSGAGKTSLFYALMRELAYQEGGEVYFNGRSVATHGDQIRTTLGFVPQQDYLHRTLTVNRLLNYADRLRRPRVSTKKDRQRRIDEVCRQLNIERQRRQLVGTLSGGQLKRVSIALELMAKPQLLMLDEPTSGLDQGMDREFMGLLNGYAARRPPTTDDPGDPRLVVVITHNTSNLNRAQQILILAREGRAVYAGPPDEMSAKMALGNFADVMDKLSSTEEADEATVERLFQSYQVGEMASRAEAALQRARTEHRTLHSSTVLRAWQSARRFLRQLPILTERQVALLIARGSSKNRSERRWFDHVSTPLVALLPLLVALGGSAIAAGVAKSGGLGPGPSTMGTLGLLITLAMLSGQSLTYVDIVGEFHTIKREHRTGAVTFAVLISKWFTFAVVAVGQAAVITVVFVLIRPGPQYGNALGPRAELFLDLAAMTVAAMTLGMLISVLASKVEQAVNWNTFIAIGEIALNGASADLSGSHVGGAFAALLPTRWGLAAAASSIDLPAVSPAAPHDALWSHTVGQWAIDLTWLGVLTVVFFTVSVGWLTRKLRRPD